MGVDAADIRWRHWTRRSSASASYAQAVVLLASMATVRPPDIAVSCEWSPARRRWRCDTRQDPHQGQGWPSRKKPLRSTTEAVVVVDGAVPAGVAAGRRGVDRVLGEDQVAVGVEPELGDPGELIGSVTFSGTA